MQKNDKCYTFLLSHSTRSKIRIRRVNVSKRLLHYTTFSIFILTLFSGLGIGVAGLFKNTDLSQTNNNPLLNNLAAVTTKKNTDQIDYSHPKTADAYSINSGGPVAMNGMELSDVEVENMLKVIQTTADPAQIPNMWAHMGRINNEVGFRRNPFGGRTYEFHAGMDIDGDRGDLVVAPANGVVIKAGWQGGYGYMVELDHGNGLTTRYGHLSKIEVQIGEPVQRGQLMAFVGSTGRSTGPHLHYELRLHDKPINPRRFLPPEPMDLAKLNG